MKVLFIGEYSNVYTELSKELKSRGINTFSISDGDYFKKYPTDYLLENVPVYNNVIAKAYRYFTFRLGLSGLLKFLKHWKKIKPHLQGNDVVQLINPVALTGFGSVVNLLLLHYLKNHNSRIFLSALGDDYYICDWFIKNDHRSDYYRTPLLKNILLPGWAAKYKYCLFYKRLNDYAIKISNRIIPGLNCYREAYIWTEKVTEVIPFPISSSKISQPIEFEDYKKVVIFHGWQKGNEKRKGNDVYDRVIKRVVEKYGDRVDYKVVQSVPFEEYLKLFSSSHIFIDQLYLEEYGYNALLGMAAGKVVFSGYNKEYLKKYPNYNGSQIGVFAELDEDKLFGQFCDLIEHTSLIHQISLNAVNHVINNHASPIVCDMYCKYWFA